MRPVCEAPSDAVSQLRERQLRLCNGWAHSRAVEERSPEARLEKHIVVVTNESPKEMKFQNFRRRLADPANGSELPSMQAGHAIGSLWRPSHGDKNHSEITYGPDGRSIRGKQTLSVSIISPDDAASSVPTQ